MTTLSSKSRLEPRLKSLYGKVIKLLKLEKIVRSIPNTFIQAKTQRWNPYYNPYGTNDNTLIMVNNVFERTGIEVSCTEPIIHTAVVEIKVI